jgi:hypothetical protein
MVMVEEHGFFEECKDKVEEHGFFEKCKDKKLDFKLTTCLSL